ncbi:protein ALP1-like [Sipha flava]|uniref:Protein ALP1-like n=1 Tax=Sipha flava TaxID=143950 RepID=A0A8B8GR20_9HEMI|nr:protein ALP1-like [Sipha flava]
MFSSSSSSGSEDEWNDLLDSSYNLYLNSPRSCWVHDLLTDYKNGEYFQTCIKLREYPEKFKEYFRMNIHTYDYILDNISNDIKKYSNFRECIQPDEKLAITIRYLSTGMSFRALEFLFKRHHYTIGKIVEDVCVAIWNQLFTKHMPIPNKENYLKISSTFEVLWNFPHVVGCLDGKHLRVKCPEKSGSMFFNYKGYYSIVLQGVADANYKFIFVDVGAYGKQSDSGTFLASDLYDILDKYKNSLPRPTKIKDTEIDMPYVMLADDAYPLKEYILKPYLKRQLTHEEMIFNYRLSRCRRCIECAFGIMCTKWRLLYKPIETKIEKAENIAKAITLLHNIIIDLDGSPNAMAIEEAMESFEFQKKKKSRNYKYFTKKS